MSKTTDADRVPIPSKESMRDWIAHTKDHWTIAIEAKSSPIYMDAYDIANLAPLVGMHATFNPDKKKATHVYQGKIHERKSP